MLAEQSELSLEEWFLKFKEWGAGSVAIQEESIRTLVKEGKPVRSNIISEVKAMIDWEQNYPKVLVDRINDVHIEMINY